MSLSVSSLFLDANIVSDFGFCRASRTLDSDFNPDYRDWSASRVRLPHRSAEADRILQDGVGRKERDARYSPSEG